jgi:hypothetical protein
MAIRGVNYLRQGVHDEIPTRNPGFVLSIAAFLLSSTSASSRDAGAGRLFDNRTVAKIAHAKKRPTPERIGRYRRCSTVGVVKYIIRGMVIAKT